jgi:hypothetical protein
MEHPFDVPRTILRDLGYPVRDRVADLLDVPKEQVEIDYHSSEDRCFVPTVEVIGPRHCPAGLAEAIKIIVSKGLEGHCYKVAEPQITCVGGIDIAFQVKGPEDSVTRDDLDEQARQELGQLLDLKPAEAEAEIKATVEVDQPQFGVTLMMVPRLDQPEETYLALLAGILAQAVGVPPTEVGVRFIGLQDAVVVGS